MQYKTMILELLQQRNGVARPATERRESCCRPWNLRQGTEGQPRSLEGTPVSGEAGQRPEPDRARSAGDSPQGTGGSFALRISSGRSGAAFPRRRRWLFIRRHTPRAEGVTPPADAV